MRIRKKESSAMARNASHDLAPYGTHPRDMNLPNFVCTRICGDLAHYCSATKALKARSNRGGRRLKKGLRPLLSAQVV